VVPSVGAIVLIRNPFDAISSWFVRSSLGLSGADYRRLVEGLSCIQHMAGRYHIGFSAQQVEQETVGGTRGALELALSCTRLRRFCLWSTIHVAGDRVGVVMEDELQAGQGFRNSYERSKYAAEQLVRKVSALLPLIHCPPRSI